MSTITRNLGRIAGVLAFIGFVLYGTWHYYGGVSGEFAALAFLAGVFVIGALEG